MPSFDDNYLKIKIIYSKLCRLVKCTFGRPKTLMNVSWNKDELNTQSYKIDSCKTVDSMKINPFAILSVTESCIIMVKIYLVGTRFDI